MMFAQLCEYTEIIELYMLNGVNFMECELYLNNTAVFKNKKKGSSEKVALR